MQTKYIAGIAVGVAVAATYLAHTVGASDPMADRVAWEDTERHAAFDPLVSKLNGSDKTLVTNLANAQLPANITPEKMEQIANMTDNELWKRRLNDYAAYLRWQQYTP